MIKKDFTAGPWAVLTYGNPAFGFTVGPAGGGVRDVIADITTANLLGIQTAKTMALGQANARLIAQSPMLVEAVEKLLNELGDSTSDAAVFAHAVLLKVEGESE